MPTRRGCLIGAAALMAAGSLAPPVRAQVAWGFPWTRVPSITILRDPGDARVPLVHDAVAFWNHALADLGSGFRVGEIGEVTGALPLTELALYRDAVLRLGGPMPASDRLRAIPGNIVVALSDGDFVSYAARWPELDKALVAVKSAWYAPLNIPNVARNVIAHEFGHVLGLGHNSDPSLLMCGRPAACRPEASFASPAPFTLPLGDEETATLLRFYPPDWRPLAPASSKPA